MSSFGAAVRLAALAFVLLTACPCPKIARTAMVSQNEQIGYAASVTIMQRLVTCLIDAADIYLAEYDASNDDDKPTTPMSRMAPTTPSGKSRLSSAKPSALDDDDYVDIEFSVQAPANNKPKRPPANELRHGDSVVVVEPLADDAKPKKSSKKQPANSSSSSNKKQPAPKVDHKAAVRIVRAVRQRLEAIRARLSALTKPSVASTAAAADKAPIAKTLNEFIEIHEQLAKVCGAQSSALHMTPAETRGYDALAYLCEANTALAEMADQAAMRAKAMKQDSMKDVTLPTIAPPPAPTSEQPSLAPFIQVGEREKRDSSIEERVALDTIKMHYAYLSQIVAAYNLVFNTPLGAASASTGEPSIPAQIIEEASQLMQAAL